MVQVVNVSTETTVNSPAAKADIVGQIGLVPSTLPDVWTGLCFIYMPRHC